jgi:sugar phosphate isomerase/epimerase
MPASRPLHFTFSTLGLPDGGWQDALETARAFGLAGVELRALQGSVDLPSALRKEFETPQRFAQAIADSGLRVPSLDSSLRLYEARDDHREELLSLAEWAHIAGIPHLRVFDGGEIGSGNRPEVRADMLRELDAWHGLKEKEGFSCDLIVETHWALIHPRDVLSFSEESGGRLRLLWDVGHTWAHSGVSLAETWSLLKDVVRHIHVKDLVRAETIRDVLPGEGMLPVPALFDDLTRDGFSGAVSLDWEKFWHRDLPPLQDALESGRKHGWW